MICQICGVAEATIHLTEIVNSQMIDLHLCEQCAKEKEVDLAPPISFSDLLSGLVDFTAREEKETIDLTCPTCGLTYEGFKKVGRLGCENCYQAFQSVLLPLIKRVQGTTQHMGKRPARMNEKAKGENELKELNDRLKKHIAREEFEEAAQVRDKIRMLTAKPEKKSEKNEKNEKNGKSGRNNKKKTV